MRINDANDLKSRKAIYKAEIATIEKMLGELSTEQYVLKMQRVSQLELKVQSINDRLSVKTSGIASNYGNIQIASSAFAD